MDLEIAAVKQEVKDIVSNTRDTPDEPLEYLLVPYNDPFDESAIIRNKLFSIIFQNIYYYILNYKCYCVNRISNKCCQ